MTVIDAADAFRSAMQSLGLVGQCDVRMDGSRSTSWVGKPGDGRDVEVVVTVRPLPPLSE